MRRFEGVVLVLFIINSVASSLLALAPLAGVLLSPYATLVLMVLVNTIPIIVNRMESFGSGNRNIILQGIEHPDNITEFPGQPAT